VQAAKGGTSRKTFGAM